MLVGMAYLCYIVYNGAAIFSIFDFGFNGNLEMCFVQGTNIIMHLLKI